MQGEKLARFMELRGRRVVELAGTLFYEAGAGIYMSVPYQRNVDLAEDEARAFLLSRRLTGLRYPSQRLPGLESGLYVRRRPYGLDCLHRNARVQVKEGLRVCEVRCIDAEQLLRDGLILNRETLLRQQRCDREFSDLRRWTRFVDALCQSPGIEAHGAFHERQLEAMAVVCREDGWFHILHKMCRTQKAGVGANHVLDYILTERALADPSVEAVCMGFVSLLDIPGLQTYKSRLGFHVEPRHCVVRLHPALAPLLLNPVAWTAVSAMRRWRPQNQWLETVQKVLSAAEQSRTPWTGSMSPEPAAGQSSSGEEVYGGLK
jgi:hypothetical protein